MTMTGAGAGVGRPGSTLPGAAFVIPAVNPTHELIGFVAGSGGNPDGVQPQGEYTGTRTLRAIYSSTLGDVTLTEEDILAGAGGDIIEQGFIEPFTGDLVEMDGFSDDNIDRVWLLVVEVDGDGRSPVSSVTVTDADFTAPVFVSADVDDAAPDVVSVVLSETLDGSATTSPSDWNVAGYTVVNATIVGDQVDLDLDAAVTDAVDLSGALSFAGTGRLEDPRGNRLEAFAGADITNNVSPVSTSDFADDFNRADAPDLGPGWAVDDPGWTISGNAAFATQNATSVAVTPASSPDIEVQFSYSNLTGDVAVFCRYDAGPSFVRFRVRTSRLDVIQRNAGVWGDELRTSGYTPPANGTLRCRIVGQDFEMLINDVIVHSGTIPETAISNPTGEVRLFGATGQTVDDFSLGPAT